MRVHHFQRRPLAAAVAAVVAVAGLAVADGSFAVSPVANSGGGNFGPDARIVSNEFRNSAAGSARYIVRFAEDPVALYNHAATGPNGPVNGNGPIPLKKMANGRSRIDVKSPQAQAYAAFLSNKHQEHFSDIAAAIGHAPVVRHEMTHAVNAAVMELSPAEVQKVRSVAGVVAVERDRPHALASDIGPGFIGAASLWWGTPAGQDTLFASGFEDTPQYRGDGLVIGDIDTGYNSESPSFQATDADGYTITNPLGSGNYLGQCNVPGISLAGCNDKVIGVYDEIDLTTLPLPTVFSVEDTQGHGSHTASTAGGDSRSASLAGYTARISGVAPHANLVIYYACSPDPTVQCSDAATTASVDQAIADGVVDALNYSISGGTDPWNESTSLAFLAAADAGIFVAAAAGNTSASVSQTPGTANHLEPWVISVAAGTHTGGAIAPDLTVTGPGSPPANVQNLALSEGSGDTPPTATISAPVVLSPNFHINNTSGSDGCAAYAANLFAGAVALVSRGTCSFYVKVENALAAGAVAVVISDNRPEAPLIPLVNDGGTAGGAVQPIPVYAVTQAQGGNLQTFLGANSNAGLAVIPYPPSRQPSQPDELANFSLLGPSRFDGIKPDVQAPGVNILAAIANDGGPDGPNLVALYNGTSMATPHTTGSGALMLGLHPDWTPLEAKSALMMTAKEDGLTKANGVTPSDFFDRGSGRLQDFVAASAGLVLDESASNFSSADPANVGNVGYVPPSELNLASMQSGDCLALDPSGTSSSVTCSFTRTFRSTQASDVTWTIDFTGVSATATPPSFLAPANALAPPVMVTVDASSFSSDGKFNFGEMTLTPSDSTLSTLHLPIAVKVPPPSIAASPSPLLINIPHSTTTKGHALTVTNTGGPTLQVTNTNDTSGSANYVVIDQVSQGNRGFYSDLFTDFGDGFYAADDFQTIGSSTNLSKLSFPGFMTGATSLSGFAGHKIHFEVYADAAGVPNGNPETAVPSYLWSYVATIGSTAGLTVSGNTIGIDLVAAGATPTALPAGTYWMTVWPEIDYGAGPWAWFESTTALGSNAHNIDPAGLAGGSTDWLDNTAGGDFPGMAMHIEEQVACGAPWLTTSPATLSLGGLLSGDVTVTANSALFPSGTEQTAFLCLDSNDAVHPILAVPVTAIQR